MTSQMYLVLQFPVNDNLSYIIYNTERLIDLLQENDTIKS